MMLRTYAKGALQTARLRLRPAAGGDLTAVAGDRAPRRTRTFTAEPQAVARFCRVVGEPVGNTAPVTYLHAQAFPASLELMSAPDFPLPLVGMVHLANSVTQHRPVTVGERVEATVWIAAIRDHAKGTEVTVATDFRVHGQLRAEETSTMLAKGVTLTGAAPAEDRPRTEFSGGRVTQKWTITGADISAYAAVSGDRNPIHLNSAAAKAFGFPRRIAHGMYTAARALAAAQVREQAFTWEVEFAAPVLLPASVAVEVHRVDERRGATDGAAAGQPAPGGASRPSPTIESTVWSPRTGKPHMFSRTLAL